jgi:PAS domain S-box-containing protein
MSDTEQPGEIPATGGPKGGTLKGTGTLPSRSPSPLGSPSPSAAAGRRRSGLAVIGDVPWGTHFCQFYQTQDDLLDILAPYFRAGLEQNEFCMWVTSEPLAAEDARAALERSVPGFADYVARGQIEILPYTDWSLLGGTFDSARVLAGWVDQLAAARAKGFEGLRLSGNTFWLERNGWRAFADYEEEINSVIGRYRMIALCTYSLDRVSAGEIIDVVMNHQFALIKRAGRWERIESAEQRKREEALRQSERRFQDLFESMAEGFALHEVLVDATGVPYDYRFLEVNPAFERLTGLRRETLIGRTVREALPGVEAVWIERYGRVALTGEPAQFEQYAAALDRHYEVNAYRTQPGRFAVVFRDVSERKKAEQALRLAKEEWERTFDSVPDLIALLDTDHRILRVNRAMAARVGKAPEACVGLPCYTVVHGRSHPPEFCPHVRTLADGRAHHEVVSEEGLGGDFDVTTTPVRNADGTLLGSVHVARDISERKRAEEAVRRVAQFPAENPNPVLRVDADRRVLYANAAATEWLRACGSTAEGPLPPAAWPLVDRAFQTDGQVEAELTDRRGRTFWFAAVKPKAEAYVNLYGRDVTERRQAEAEVERQREWLRVTLTSIGDAVIAGDSQGRITFFNPVAAALTGWRPEEALGQPIARVFRVVNERTKEPGEDLAARVLSEKRPVVLANSTALLTRDGLEVPIEDSAAPILDAGGEAVGVVLVFHNVAEKRRAQEVVRRSEERLRQASDLLEAVTAGAEVIVAAVDTDLRYTFFNQAYREEVKRLSGKEIEIGSSLSEAFAHLPEQQAVAVANWRRVLAGESGTFTVEFGDPSTYRRVYSVRHAPIRDDRGNVVGAGEVAFDVTEQVRADEVRRQREAELQRLNRTLTALSRSNQVMMRADDERTYLNDVCQLIVEDCGHSMVWIGYAEEDEGRRVRPAASAGFEEGYLEALDITWADTERGRGPTGTAIRTGRATLCRNMQTDPAFAPWRAEAVKRGYASSVALPLLFDGRAFGALCIYAREPDRFTDAEMVLLSELAGDLAHGIRALRARAAHARAETALRENEERLRRAQEIAHLGSWELDLVRNRLTWSDEVYRIFGLRPQEFAATYEAFLEQVHPEDRAAVNQAYSASLRDGRDAYEIEHRVVRRTSGEVRVVHERCRHIRDAAGRVVRSVGMVHDITDRKQAEESLRVANQQLNELAQTLEKRVNQRTAELRLAIRNLQQEAQERRRAEEQLEVLNAALRRRAEQLRRLAADLTLAEQRERQRLAALLHDHLQQLLAGARFQVKALDAADGPAARRGLADLDALLVECINAARTLTGELSPPVLREGGLAPALEWLARWMTDRHGLVVRLAAEDVPDLPEDVKVLLFQAVRELLFNVSKHAQVSVADVRVGRTDDGVVITVADQGVGFDARREQGVDGPGGFGLMNIRERLDLMGGGLTIESAPGRGSRFTLSAPVSAPVGGGPVRAARAAPDGVVANATRASAAPRRRPAARRIRVLLADDHVLVRQGLVQLLGAQPDIEIVGEADDGEEAVALSERLKPDIVVMDMRMPKMNGMEALLILRQSCPQTKVVVLSMYAEPHQVKAVTAAGAAAYVAKTDPTETLLAAIRTCGKDERNRKGRKERNDGTDGGKSGRRAKR